MTDARAPLFAPSKRVMLQWLFAALMLAAFAGAAHRYGSLREQAVMYAYMPQVPAPGRPRNVKTSMLDVRNIEDYTRTILVERRRRRAENARLPGQGVSAQAAGQPDVMVRWRHFEPNDDWW